MQTRLFTCPVWGSGELTGVQCGILTGPGRLKVELTLGRGLDSTLCAVIRAGSAWSPGPAPLYTTGVTSFPFLTSQPHLQTGIIMIPAHRLV